MFKEAEKVQSLIEVAEYVIDCESREYESYVEYCEENSLDPALINAPEQSSHVYAKALIGLGLEFPTD